MQTRFLLPALVLVLTGATGCLAYRYSPEPPSERLTGQLPNPLRLTRVDGTHATLYDPQLTGDTLVGWDEPEHTARFARQLVQIPVADVRAVRVRQFSPAGTLLIWMAVPLAIGVAAVIANGGCLDFVLGC